MPLIRSENCLRPLTQQGNVVPCEVQLPMNSRDGAASMAANTNKNLDRSCSRLRWVLVVARTSPPPQIYLMWCGLHSTGRQACHGEGTYSRGKSVSATGIEKPGLVRSILKQFTSASNNEPVFTKRGFVSLRHRILTSLRTQVPNTTALAEHESCFQLVKKAPVPPRGQMRFQAKCDLWNIQLLETEQIRWHDQSLLHQRLPS